jgi:hypothetical protein
LNQTNSVALLNKTLASLVNSTTTITGSVQTTMNESKIAETVSSAAYVLNKVTKKNDTNKTEYVI